MSKLLEDSINSYGLDLIFQDEPIEHQDATSEIDAPTDQAPKHGDGSSSEYGFDWLFDEDDTAGEYTRLDAAPQSATVPTTPSDEEANDKTVTDEDEDGDCNLNTLSNDAPDEHGDATTAVDPSASNTPTKADMATDLQAKADTPAGDEVSTMSPPTEQASNDDTQNGDANPQGASADHEPRANAPIADIAMVGKHKSVGVAPLEASLEEISAMDISEKHASTDGAPIGRGPNKPRPVQLVGIVAPTQDAPMAGVTVDEPPKDDTTMPDALTAAEPNPADAADASSTLPLLPYAASTPPNDSTKPENVQSLTVSPLSSSRSSPSPNQGLQRLLTSSKIAGTLQLAARKRKVDKAGHSAGPDAKRKKLGPTTTTTTVPAPRLKRRRKSGVSTRGFGATKIPTRSITRNATTRNVTTRSVARSITRSAAIAFTAAAPAPPTQALGKRKAYTINIGHSTSPSANKRVKLSPSPTPTPASSPTLTTRRVTRAAAATSIAIATRGRTAMPTPTARHTRSKGSQYLLFFADIVGLERGSRRRMR